MANSVKHAFSDFFSQLAVVCLLGLFVMISLIAMFTTAGVPNEMDWIGMTVKALSADGAAARGIPSDSGVLIEEVDGIAARAGIRHGDVLLAINGNRVRDMGDFANLTDSSDISKGGVQLDVIRRGARIPVFVSPPGGASRTPGRTAPGRAAQIPGQAARGGITQPPAVIDRRWLGVEAETLATGEGRELGIPVGIQGVLIDAVTRGSQAQRAGLGPNDIIVSVNGRPIDSTIGLWNTLAGLNSSDRVEFGVYKNGQLMSVVLPTTSGTLAGGFGGRMGGVGLGPGGSLICPNCQTKVTHQRGVPSVAVSCPSCGTWMIRER
jgi:S1-C subfamily serine protease